MTNLSTVRHVTTSSGDLTAVAVGFPTRIRGFNVLNSKRVDGTGILHMHTTKCCTVKQFTPCSHKVHNFARVKYRIRMTFTQNYLVGN